MYGIESGNPQILKNLRKDTNLEHMREAVKLTKRYGVKALGFFIMGSPGDTPETIDKTIKFACDLDLDYVQFTKMIPFPNTEIYEMYMKEYRDDYLAELYPRPVLREGATLGRYRLNRERGLRLR